ncbi:hypothetical protein KY289_016755 [Solanum tuberosum]|nr:hypothetical protein KY289_016755 [Solanum tuberosum]
MGGSLGHDKSRPRGGVGEPQGTMPRGSGGWWGHRARGTIPQGREGGELRERSLEWGRGGRGTTPRGPGGGVRGSRSTTPRG